MITCVSHSPFVIRRRPFKPLTALFHANVRRCGIVEHDQSAAGRLVEDDKSRAGKLVEHDQSAAGRLVEDDKSRAGRLVEDDQSAAGRLVEDDKFFGARLRETRRQLCFTQVELARRAGVAAVTISRIERDKQKPTARTLENLSRATSRNFVVVYNNIYNISKTTTKLPNDKSRTTSPRQRRDAADVKKAPVIRAERAEVANQEPDRAFEAFWEVYPEHKKKFSKKADSRAAWDAHKAAGTLPDLAFLFRRLWLQAGSLSWTNEGGRYVPKPHVWLQESRWARDMAKEPKNRIETMERFVQERLRAAGVEQAKKSPEPPQTAEDTTEELEASVLESLRRERREREDERKTFCEKSGFWQVSPDLKALLARGYARQRITESLKNDLETKIAPEDFAFFDRSTLREIARQARCEDLTDKLLAMAEGSTMQAEPKGQKPEKQAPENFFRNLADKITQSQQKSEWKSISKTMTHAQKIAYLEQMTAPSN